MGHGHDHSHHPEEAVSDRGSRITLIGLLVNIALSAVKAGAGVLLNSAALVADAAHSLSDLFGDFVVLLAWKMSRRSANDNYPFGYGKYESLGTAIVAVLLITGGAGIGFHSFSLLRHSDATDSHSHATHSHSHHHGDALDPNAAWFALGSVLIKEYLFRITKKVAIEEKSNVLMANALHHRSDAFSGIVALVAIATTYFGFTLADPIGGLVVAGMIAKQGVQMFLSSLFELLDASSDPTLPSKLKPLLESNESSLKAVKSIKSFKSGPLSRVEIEATVDSTLSVVQLIDLEQRLLKLVKEFTHDEVSEVILRPR